MNEQPRDALPPGARLDGDKYAIEEVLGSGGGWPGVLGSPPAAPAAGGEGFRAGARAGTGAESGHNHSAAGGGRSVSRCLRSAYRYRYTPSDRYGSVGFRLVQDLNP